MISVAEADEHISRLVTPVAAVELPLGQCAGRCSRKAVVARRAAPPFDRVMMDGFAVRVGQSDERRFRIVGTAAAGEAPPKLEDGSCAIEVMTGAMLPPGADCVVPVEECAVRGEEIELKPGIVLVPGKHIHRCGSDYAKGSLILSQGARLHAAHLALAASEGYASLLVNDDLQVQLITTGDEIVTAGATPLPWQIFGTHAVAIEAAFSKSQDITFNAQHVPDNLASLVEAIAGARRTNVIILCGGMSKGRKDFAIEAMQQCGFTVAFHRVAQRPGHPMALASSERTLLFGLPGNPLAVLFTLYRYVLPALDQLRGCDPPKPLRVPASGKLPALPDATRFVPCRIEAGLAHVSLPNNSGDLQPLADSHGFVEIPPGAPSELVPFWPW